MQTRIKRFASEHPLGFTIKPETFEVPKKGFAVAMNETQNSFGDEGLSRALDKALEHGDYLGGWYNYEDGQYYYDWTKVFEDEETARRVAKEQRQIAYYNIEKDIEVRI